jgi:hypothetical protein
VKVHADSGELWSGGRCFLFASTCGLFPRTNVFGLLNPPTHNHEVRYSTVSILIRHIQLPLGTYRLTIPGKHISQKGYKLKKKGFFSKKKKSCGSDQDNSFLKVFFRICSNIEVFLA